MKDSLRIAAILHYIVGALHGLVSCLFLLNIVFGLFMMVVPGSQHATSEQADSPAQVGGILAACSAVLLVLGVIFSWLTIYSGLCIAHRKKRTFSIVIAALNCLSFPLGLGLGIFTLILLFKKEVRVLYQGGAAPTLT